MNKFATTQENSKKLKNADSSSGVSAVPARKTGLKALGVAACVVVLFLATGCDFISKKTADAWSVTYRVDVEGPAEAIKALKSVSYEKAPSRGEGSAKINLGEVSTTSSATSQNQAQWESTAQVTATKHAAVSATPRASAVATCHILLDGKQELVSEKGAPGAAVTCSVDTPAFSKK